MVVLGLLMSKLEIQYLVLDQRLLLPITCAKAKWRMIVTGGAVDIGVDVGGTHTDVQVLGDGRIVRGKALTTYDDFSVGVLGAIGVAAREMGVPDRELLARTRLMVNGTTVVTNAITEMRGSRVGVFVTTGFKDTFRIAGGPRVAAFDDHLQHNVPDIVDRGALAEIDGRIDSCGAELVGLDERQVREHARRLVEEAGVEAFAVCLLNSYLEPRHELRVEVILHELYPDRFVTPSHRVHRLMGESRRWTTAVLNSFVQARAQRYIESLSAALTASGLTTTPAYFQGLGGGTSGDRALTFPLSLLGSGPAGGAIGARALAERMGVSDVLIGDMGGTSFDTGLVSGGDLPIERNIDLGQLRTGVTRVNVVSIGAGGGSIVTVSERGVPQVGPRSAGSTPGPACYGRGGTEPTVTDAMVALGIIDPGNYLAGRHALRADLAVSAMDTVAAPFGWSIEEAAAAVHDLVVASMANAMREVSVGQGHDPRGFVFLAYGGTLPMFAVQMAAALDIAEVVIPRASSVFCAGGLLAADFLQRHDRTLQWRVGDADRLDDVNAALAELVADGTSGMGAEGFAADEIEVVRTGHFQFKGQVYELPVDLPARPLTDADGPALAEEFRALYERVYGEGTAWKHVPTQLVSVTVTVVGRRPRPAQGAAAPAPADPDTLVTAHRDVYLPDARRRERVPVYDGRRFTVGTEVAGPAIIDESDTTIYVPPDAVARRDELESYRIRRSQA